MDQKKFNKIFFALATTAILVAILGTILLINYTGTLEQDLESQDSNSGTVSLNIAGKTQDEYSSSGMISLNIVSEESENNT
jgi:hypothetical protein